MEVRILFGATNYGRVTALVCKTNPRQQIAVLAFAVSEFESHLSHSGIVQRFSTGDFESPDIGSIPITATS